MSLPTTMRQIRYTGAGGPDVIKLETGPVPTPSEGQVLVEVAAAGINRPDCLQRAGGYPPPPGATEIPGLEISGKVVALGAGVTDLKIGDLVCALVISGGYAEYCIAEAPLCLPIPKGLSLLEAAGLPENVFTVYDNIITRGRLTKGETIVIHGGSSGIGYTAIQLAKYFGAHVIATAGSKEKCDFCLSMVQMRQSTTANKTLLRKLKTSPMVRAPMSSSIWWAAPIFRKISIRWLLKAALCKSPFCKPAAPNLISCL